MIIPLRNCFKTIPHRTEEVFHTHSIVPSTLELTRWTSRSGSNAKAMLPPPLSALPQKPTPCKQTKYMHNP
eukprot:2613920-Amphidinium_carterae.1